MIYILLDEFNVITSYSIKLSDNQVFSDEWIVIDTDIDLDLLIFNYKYVNGELIELAEEKQRYLNTIRPITLEEQVELLQEENKALNERLNEYEIMMTSMYKTLIDKDVVTLSEVPKSIIKKL